LTTGQVSVRVMALALERHERRAERAGRARDA
jgi:hypothetical protein